MKITLLVLLLLIFERSYQQCLTSNDASPPKKGTRPDLYTGQQAFSLNLLQAINRLMPNENLFFSPYSTYHALVIAYFIAGNQTEAYLQQVLNLDKSQSKNDIYVAYKLDRFATENRAANSNSSYEFNNANKIYISNEIPVRECIPQIFPYELEKLNFKNNPELSRTFINNWVENVTHNMIKDLLPFGTIDKETNLVLVNAAYFKGMWENKFNPSETKPEIFYVNPSKQIMVDMMHVEGTFNHDVSESLGAHILEMPYEGSHISMYIFLPPFTKDDAIDATLKKLTLDKFKALIETNSLTAKTVQVSLPKFSLEHTIELVPVLENIGVGDLFTPEADFSILTSRNISLGGALHKAKIEVNEEGTRAAAATVLFTFRSSRPAEPAQFQCNHPFIYFIYDKVEASVLFAGVFRRPY